jgi:dipeptidyl aminopeptidase/acylaminoacyl peptidase
MTLAPKLCLVLAIGGLAVAPPAAQASFPGANGRIAFSSDRSGDFEIYTINPDGSDLKRLTNAPGSDGVARWSPDGTKLTFSSDREGNAEIYTMNADGSGETRLTSNPAQDSLPSWSPDGTKIAFTRLPQAGANPQIVVINADGSGETQITQGTPAPAPEGVPGGGYFHSEWGPDGRIAVAAFTPGTTFQIYLMNGDGSGQRQLTQTAANAITPTWSPDATKVAYVDQGQFGGIHAINVDGTGDTQLTPGTAQDGLGSYSPDGTKIVFSSNRDGGAQQVYTMNADGSDQKRLLTSGSNDVGAEWQAAPLPAPKLGETVNVSVVSGTVLVKTRGSSKFSTLAQARQIKVGAQLDTSRGVVRLASAAGKGKTQSGDFGRGVFTVAQAKAAKGLTDLKLKGGKFSSCKGAGKKASAAKKKTIRSLFSKAKGKFRTKGRYSAASVRGTTWLVADRCDGTLTSVTSGVVSVFDFKRRKTVKVKAGKSYLARASR